MVSTMTRVGKVKIPEGYKQTEIGVIPKDWELTTIDKVLSITTGNKNTQDKINDGLYPFYVRSQTVERINSYSFDGEGVLTAGDGVGTGKIFHYINGKCDIHQRVYLMHKFSNRLDGYYFYIFFKKNFYDKVMSMTAKSSVDSVRREMIADMNIALPSIKEQTAIANALSDVDKLIAALETLIAKKSAIKTAAMQQLLTGKKRLPAFVKESEQENEKQGSGLLAGSGTTNQAAQSKASKISASLTKSTGQTAPRPGYKQTELGETNSSGTNLDAGTDGPQGGGMDSRLIPEDWEDTTIGEFAPLQRGFDLPNRDRKNGAFPVVYSNGIVNFHNQYQVKGPGVVTGRSGTIGKVHYVEGNYWPHNTSLWVKEFKNAVPKYVYYLYIKIGFDRFASGSGVPTLNRNDAHSFRITVPKSKEEQTAIANVLSDMDTELDALQQRLSKTQKIKQGMMQELLTGKTRLIKGVKQ